MMVNFKLPVRCTCVLSPNCENHGRRQKYNFHSKACRKLSDVPAYMESDVEKVAERKSEPCGAFPTSEQTTTNSRPFPNVAVSRQRGIVGTAACLLTAMSKSTLSSVVSNLVRASMGASVSSSVTDQDLDKHVAELILKEAKQKAEKYAQQGIRAYLPAHSYVSALSLCTLCIHGDGTALRPIFPRPTSGSFHLSYGIRMNIIRRSSEPRPLRPRK